MRSSQSSLLFFISNAFWIGKDGRTGDEELLEVRILWEHAVPPHVSKGSWASVQANVFSVYKVSEKATNNSQLHYRILKTHHRIQSRIIPQLEDLQSGPEYERSTISEKIALKSFLLTCWNSNVRLASNLFQPLHSIIRVRKPYGLRPEMPSALMNFLQRSSRSRLLVPGASCPAGQTHHHSHRTPGTYTAMYEHCSFQYTSAYRHAPCLWGQSIHWAAPTCLRISSSFHQILGSKYAKLAPHIACSRSGSGATSIILKFNPSPFWRQVPSRLKMSWIKRLPHTSWREAYENTDDVVPSLSKSLGSLVAFEGRNVAPNCLAVEFANPFQHIRWHGPFQTMWNSNVDVLDIRPSYLANASFNLNKPFNPFSTVGNLFRTQDLPTFLIVLNFGTDRAWWATPCSQYCMQQSSKQHAGAACFEVSHRSTM